ETIEEAGFANIGTADNCQCQTFMNEFPINKRFCKPFKRRLYFGNSVQNLAGCKDRNIVLSKIYSSFKRCDQSHQLLFGRLQAARERAFELPGCNFGLIQGL